MRRRPLVVIGLVALAGCRSSSAPSSTAPHLLEPNGRVAHVVDGDTAVVDFGPVTETVRFIGINTPETVKPNAPVECFGPEASARAKTLLPEGTEVRVERDAEPRDVYGRLLGYVYRAEDGLFVNLTLVAGGYAEPLSIEPNTAHRSEFVEAAHRFSDGGKRAGTCCRGKALADCARRLRFRVRSRHRDRRGEYPAGGKLGRGDSDLASQFARVLLDRHHARHLVTAPLHV